MKIVYAYVVYIAYSLASTVVNIPYHSLTPVLSEDPFQRTVIVSWKQGMGTVSQFVITVLALPLVEIFGGGKQGWAMYGALIGIMTTISFWLCAWGGKPYDVCDMAKTPKKENPLKDLVYLAKNKPMLMLMIAFGTDVLANATYSAVNMYYFKYVLHREDLVAVAATAILIAGIVSIPLLPECSDYAEWKFGKRADGLMSSSLTFINKFGMAIGGFIASFFLGLVGFEANQEQTQTVINMIVFLRFGMPVLGYIASLISMIFYEITEEKYAEIRSELDKKQKNTQADTKRN